MLSWVNVHYRLSVWRLTLVSTIFQLIRGGQFYLWIKREYPKKTTNLSQITDKLYHIIINVNSNMTSFFSFVNKRAIYRLGIISLAHAPVHVTDFPVVNVHVDELSSARIWQHKLCATLSANVNINYRLQIKVYYRICTLRHIRIEINHESQNVFWLLTWVGGY
jgi:hypothetical protein